MDRLKPKIQYNVIYIIGILLLLYVFGFFIIRKSEKKHLELIKQEQQAQYQEALENLLKINGLPYRNLVENVYSRWDEMCNYIHEPDELFVKEELDILVSKYDYDVYWVYNKEFILVKMQNITGDPLMSEIPVPEDKRNALFDVDSKIHFFCMLKNGLLEIRGSTINNSSDEDRISQACGYFFLGRLWDEKFFWDLEKVSNGQLRLIYTSIPVSGKRKRDDSDISVIASLYSWNDKDIAKVEYTVREPLIDKFNSLTSSLFKLYIALGIAIIVIVFFLIYKWIYRPIKLISISLANNNYLPIDNLIAADNEIGYLSGLIKKSIRQKYLLLKTIQRQEKTGRKLKISEERFRELINQLPDSIVVHQNGKIVYVNEASCGKLGYTKDEIIDSSILRFIYRDDHPKVLKAMKRRLQGEKIEDYEISILDAKGEKHTVIVRSSIVIYMETPAILTVLIDITERKEFEEQLLESKAWLKDILDNLPYKAWLKDINGKFVVVNKPFANHYGMEPDEFIGKTDYDICQKEIARQFEIEDKQVLESKRRMFYESESSTTTEGVWFETYKSPIFNTRGEIIGITGIARDITELKRKQFELIKAKENADSANLTKMQFISTMSHEMRSTLNAIIGLTNLLIEENPKPEQLDNLKTLSFSAEHLISLIGDILDLSKIEAGKVKFEKKEFSLQEQVNNMVHTFNLKAEEKKLKLVTILDKDIPDILIGDPVRLNQILINLVGNAIKFTKKGKIAVIVNILKRCPYSLKLQFRVEDTGIGISKEKIEKVFDPFVQANEGVDKIQSGTGLGLSITKKLIEMQNGTIQLESEIGKGSVFTFTLEFLIKEK
ncbi:MAG: PAS domain S-box protein, partial [Bacteroidetes bacterium]|nr:PAS domain S-box protein [Bacteroidota bacterium]